VLRLLGERLQGETYYTPEQYTRGIEDQSVERLQTEPDGPCCTSHPHLLCHGDDPEVSPYRGTALPRQATSDQPDASAIFQKPTGKPAPQIFRFFPASLATTGMRPCYHTPLCGVARGFAGLSVVDGLSGDTWSLRRGWWGPRHGAGRACARRADSAWPVVHTTLSCGSSHFIFDSISSPIIG